MIKTLHVISSMAPTSGGPCQGLRNSIPEFMALGSVNEVVCLDERDASFLRQDPFPIYALGKSRGPWYYSPHLLPWLSEHIHKYQALIVHGLWLYPGFAVRKAVNKLRALNQPSPQVHVMPHGMLDPYFQKDSSRRFKAIRNIFYWHAIEKHLIRDAAAVFFTCEEELLLARQNFSDYRPQREINVGYGVAQPPAFDPRMKVAFQDKCSGLNGEPYLLFISRIHPKKGIDLLLGAYARMAKEHGTHGGGNLPHLVIAGPLDSDYGQKMEKLAKSLGLHVVSETNAGANQSARPTVYFPGMLQGDAKWGAFYGCEAFVLPSHQENFGIAVVESLACGIPVLISKKVNIWREIVDCEAGLATNDELESTYKMLCDFRALNSEQRQMMSRKAHECVELHFHVRSAALRLVQALQSTLNPS